MASSDGITPVSHIAWYARDGHLHLFPQIDAALRELGLEFQAHYVCHHPVEAARLREQYGVAEPWVLGRYLRDGWSSFDVSDASLDHLQAELSALPVARGLWSEMFERRPGEDELARNLVGHVRFWNDFLRQNRIDVLVSERPSILSTCVAWLVCRRLGVRFVDFIDLPIDGRMVLSTSWEGHFDGLEALALDAARPPDPEAGRRAVEYLDRMLAEPRKTFEALMAMEAARRTVRFDLTWLRHLPEIPAFLRRTRLKQQYYLFDSLTTTILEAARLLLHRWSHRFADVFDRALDPERTRYFLLPLHRGGEWSDYAWMGLGYADQAAMVARVASCTPPGSYVFVKEHTGGFGERPPAFYRSLRRLPRVRLVDPFADTFHLLRRCRAVVTLGSTMGFEASMIGKPVILLGRPWYGGLPGFARASTDEELTDLMRRVDDLVPATRAQTLRAIAALFEISFDGVKVPHPDAFQPDNVRRLAAALGRFISQPRELAPRGLRVAQPAT